MTISAILFDKDGTLYDFQATWGNWAAGFLARLSDGDPVLAELLADALKFDTATQVFAAESVAIAGTPEDMADTLLPFLANPPVRSDLIARLDAEASEAPLAEAVPLTPFLADLSGRGYQLGVVTNDAEAPARAHLRASGIHDVFGFVAGYDSGFGAKPGPGQLQAACQHLGCTPNTAVMVGDSLHDLMAGRAAGLYTVGVLTGLAGEAELAPLADSVLPDIGHLTGWLDAHR
ncbi:MAG: HAD family hydrolase [Pseudomonadota bacterium]